MKEKSIQIPEALLYEICKHLLLGMDGQEAAGFIKAGLERRLGGIAGRDLHARYKRAPTEEERESARQECLGQAGIRASFRW